MPNANPGTKIPRASDPASTVPARPLGALQPPPPEFAGGVGATVTDVDVGNGTDVGVGTGVAAENGTGVGVGLGTDVEVGVGIPWDAW